MFLFIQQITLVDRKLRQMNHAELHPNQLRFDAFLFVYSIADTPSVINIRTWYDDIANFKDNALCVLVGNKCDLEEDRQVTPSLVRYIADNLMLDSDNLFEISAKTGEGFDELFKFLVQKLGTIEKEESGSLWLHFKIDDRVSVCDKHGIAHHGTVCWTGVKKRIGRKDGEMCVEIQMVRSYNFFFSLVHLSIRPLTPSCTAVSGPGFFQGPYGQAGGKSAS